MAERETVMIQNRELTMEDYVAMLRRRLWVIIIPALIAPAIGFGISYLLSAKYTSSASVLVEGQKVPEGYVKPILSEDLMQRITALEQQVLSRNRLQPMIERLGLAKGNNVDEVVDQIRSGIDLQPMEQASNVKRKPGQTDFPGFILSYTAPRPREAQQVCSELTSMLLEENLKTREQVAQGTTDFLSRQLEEAKKSLDEQDSKLAAFKRQYVGQLPGDADNNLKILMGLNSQLDATTQTINRAQQDKAYAESVMAQQVAALQASGSTSSSPQALEQQLAAVQNQLVQLRARYTDDHPDVVKAKSDIAQIKKQLEQVSSAKPTPVTDKQPLTAETPELRQLRVQIHQYQDTINQGTQDQKKLQEQIKLYQGRVALSPAVEEQYKQLTRDYDSAQKFYDDLLAKKSQSEMATDMERQQQGEQFRLLNPGSFPSAPSFPNRLMFAGGGFGGGLFLGLIAAFLLEMRDKSMRNEQDVEAVMELPMLVALPWVGETASTNGNGNGHKPPARESETNQEIVGV
jgi:polysaccharide chain length determinant protein (PEP-CTERM system associated)